MIPIIDLHCDLLAYLSGNQNHTILDSCSRASYPQLKEGGVQLQTMAIYTPTGKGSSKSGLRQIEIFEDLLHSKRDCFHYGLQVGGNTVGIVAAIENLSSLIEEDEPLECIFKRLEEIHQKYPLLYLSLTWNSENRFGGGNETKIGLKEDGRAVLEFLHDKKIAIDLSHTSDSLAENILNTIEQKKLHITPIASHSNFRSIVDHPRNLPNEFAKEIMRKGGVMGINFVAKFLGDKLPEAFFRHIDHAISLGGEDFLCFGADFFYDLDSPNFSHLRPFFHETYGNAACYSGLIKQLQTRYSNSLIEKISYKNIQQYFMARGPACLSLAT